MNKKEKKSLNQISSTKKQDPPLILNMTFEEALIKALNTRLILKAIPKKNIPR